MIGLFVGLSEGLRAAACLTASGGRNRAAFCASDHIMAQTKKTELPFMTMFQP